MKGTKSKVSIKPQRNSGRKGRLQSAPGPASEIIESKTEKVIPDQNDVSVRPKCEIEDGSYQPLPHECVIAHIKIIENGRVKADFGKMKDTFAVFNGEKFIGKVERYKGNAMWTAVPFGGGSTKSSKSIANTVFSLIKVDLEKAILCRLPKVER